MDGAAGAGTRMGLRRRRGDAAVFGGTDRRDRKGRAVRLFPVLEHCNISTIAGVYPAMFEQSLLIDHGGSRKTATFAASLTAQIVLAGVLLIAPLFYHEVLPALRAPAVLPVLTIWHPPEAPAVASRTATRSNGLALPVPFRAPVPIRSDYPQADMVILDYTAPAIATAPVVPAFPTGTSVPSLDGPTATTLVKPTVIPALETPVRVGGEVQSAKLIKRVVPAYPQSARQLRISGVVHLLGIIARDGTIQRLQVVSGHPLLRQAALEAVSQWVYRPTVLNGQPVEVEAPIDVIFTLSR
jgi:protein TonB